jgi:hypothetical protein
MKMFVLKVTLRAETCRCKVLKKESKIMLDYILSLYVIIGSSHKGDALPKIFT